MYYIELSKILFQHYYKFLKIGTLNSRIYIPNFLHNLFFIRTYMVHTSLYSEHIIWLVCTALTHFPCTVYILQTTCTCVFTLSGSGRGLPGVYFYYELSTIHSRVVETRPGIFAFLTSVCAVVGGLYTVLGLVNQVVSLVQEMRIGPSPRKA